MTSAVKVEIVSNKVNAYAQQIRGLMSSINGARKTGNKKQIKAYRKMLDDTFANYCSALDGK